MSSGNAQVDAINSQNHGAVEICAIKQFVSMLELFLSLRLEKLPVWKNLLRMLGSDMEEEVAAAGTCLRNLTDPSSEGVNPNWEPFYLNGERIMNDGDDDDEEEEEEEDCRTGIHAYRDWRLSSKLKLLISVLSVSVVGGSVVLHKTNTNKSNSTQ